MTRQILARVIEWLRPKQEPAHLLVGKTGEKAARKYLQKKGLIFLTANFRSTRGEIDLIFREADCLVFVEVKTRTSELWGRPADAVDRERRWRLTRAALDYMRLLKNPRVKIRFDIVEVLLDGDSRCEVRHLPNSFAMERPYGYYA